MDCISQTPLRTRRKSNKTKMGQIQLILGPMFSGKSTELIRRLKRYQIARYPCLIVKYAKDIRYDLESIATHDQQTLKAISADKLKNLKVNLNDYDVIGIDEGQFFPDIVEFSEEMANKGKTVVIAALDGTFQRKAFASILELIPLSEHVVKLNAVCMTCFGDGSFTKRISADKEVEVIGGADMYMATCRSCFFAPGVVPASPRIPLKTMNNGTKENIQVETNNVDNDEIIPYKKALFDTEQAIENAM